VAEAARLDLIEPDWPAPPSVRALATGRAGGVSLGAYASLNLGDHVGDAPAHVAANRALLRRVAGLPAEPEWLRQVHGNTVARAGAGSAQADAIVTSEPCVVCAVLTADCLPVLFCDETGRHVAAAHAGWRGLTAGILEATVAQLRAGGAGKLLAWLGPAISAPAYEVGGEVRDELLGTDPRAAEGFTPNAPGRWQMDLPGIAKRRLLGLGVAAVYGGTACTYDDPVRFFSYRRDGVTGRQATLIWLNPGAGTP
jgi:YfiH family protein